MKIFETSTWKYEWLPAIVQGTLNLPWTTLRAIGKSKIVNLTILIPFIGWLILFNQQVIDWLHVAPSILGFHDANPDPNVVQTVFLRKLYVTYFGLMFLGLGSTLFQIFCPNETKIYPDKNDFVANEMEHTTDTLARMHLFENAQRYSMQHPSYDFTTGDFSWRHLWGLRSFPDNLSAIFGRYTHALWEAMDGDYLHYNGDPSVAFDDDAYGEFGPVTWERERIKTASDMLMVDEFIATVASELRVNRDVVSGAGVVAPKMKQDNLAIRFEILSFSKPIIRLAILLLYGAGFATLAIPTVSTLAQILKRAIA